MSTDSIQPGRRAAHTPEIYSIVEGLPLSQDFAGLEILGSINQTRAELEIHKIRQANWTQNVDAKRAMGAPFSHVSLDRDFATYAFGHYGLEARRPRELNIYEAMRPQAVLTVATHIAYVKQLMALGKELERIELLRNPATWSVSGNYTDLAGGFEWDDPGGDMLGDISAGLVDLEDSTHYAREYMTLFLSSKARQAAYDSAGFNAWAGSSAGLLAPSNPRPDQKLERLSAYLGVEIKSNFPAVTTFNSAAEPVEVDAWGSNGTAILYLDHKKTPVASLGDIETRSRLGAQFGNRKFDLTSTIFYKDSSTWAYRHEDTGRAAVIDDAFAIVFDNPHAAP